MIGLAMTQALRAWAAQGGPAFAAELLTDSPDPHGLCEAASWRARFALACQIEPSWTVKALAHALNDWLGGDRFHSGVVLDASFSPGARDGLFDVVVWHPGGGGEKAANSPDRVPPAISRRDFILAGGAIPEGDLEGSPVNGFGRVVGGGGARVALAPSAAPERRTEGDPPTREVPQGPAGAGGFIFEWEGEANDRAA